MYINKDEWTPEATEAEQSEAEQGAGETSAAPPSEHSEELTQLLDMSPSGMFEKTSPTPQTLSVVGETLVFRGDLTAEEDLLIQGRVSGSITHRAQNLTIGASGDVKADIVAQHVIIQGKVRGDVRASESIIVAASARVEGNLYAPTIGLKEGAKFKGSIDMDPGSWEQRRKPAPSAPAQSQSQSQSQPETQAPPQSQSQSQSQSRASSASKKKSSSRKAAKAAEAAEAPSEDKEKELSDAKVDNILE